MSVFKCKMCGGNVEFENGATVGICDSCGTKQTLPRLDDEKRANLYDRANHFRRNNEYDKAMGIYEQILSEDNTDSEAYWSLVLCRYGIEYVEDPATHKRLPTVNRAQFTSIFADEDYKSALQYADGYQKEIYEQEARAIDEIQKGILAISQKEEPFDIFICYKETDKDGRRTQDSVLANDLYHQLTQEGFKVFFSRITLEDKLGTAYEPYIFAALNSAKVMVVLGTKPEYFNAVWVKNEWSRYLALVKQSGGKRILIPAYRDMDPYDLPDEFSHLQAQDMSKLGFMQDLIRGIKKIISVDEPKPTLIKETVISDVNTDTSPLLKRAFMFLEDKNWQEADEYCEKVLDRNPECAEAYLGKLMAELQVCKIEELADCDEPFDSNNNYQKAVRFSGDKLSNTLNGYIDHIKKRNEKARLEKIYLHAVNTMKATIIKFNFEEAAKEFESIAGYKDSAELAKKCREETENKRKDDIYNSAFSIIKSSCNKKAGYKAAAEMFESISGWKDADEQLLICQRKTEEIKAKEETERLEAERKAEDRRLKAEKAAKKRKKIAMITIPIVCLTIALLVILQTVIIPIQRKKAFISVHGLVKVGSYITFGAYEQDNNSDNGKEDIKWLVLAIEGKKALIISKYALDCQPFNTSDISVTWETCSLRKWLNETFLSTAFTDKEQSFIINTNTSDTAADKVFLLSAADARKYYSSDEERMCLPTKYALSHNTETDDYLMKRTIGKDTCWWWLRDISLHPYVVGSAGGIRVDLEMDNYSENGVRPAMWIGSSK